MRLKYRTYQTSPIVSDYASRTYHITLPKDLRNIGLLIMALLANILKATVFCFMRLLRICDRLIFILRL